MTRTLRRQRLLVGVLISMPGIGSHAAEADFRLKEGVGKETVATSCVLCHSLDYIEMNAPIMTRSRWQASVRKMIDRMGAPISEPDAAVILQYLSATYAADEN